jgi:diazepam-binding inhibitor (GABA receptor modulating acyl-CoA-binding protein)
MGKKLDQEFEEAYHISSNTTIKLPPDIMLALYANYKQATKGTNYERPSGTVQLRNSFKLNAWIQLSRLTEDQAKQGYIDLVNNHLK